tara:strand:+ start:83 stop:2953 length:2871 start_codon:yes stop_codon:yes gene_type:complete
MSTDDNINNYHLPDCEEPNEKSLYLTLQGIYYYILAPKVMPSNIEQNIQDFKNDWLNNDITNEQLQSLLLRKPAITKDILVEGKLAENGSAPSNIKNILTNIEFLSIFRSRGPPKLAPKTATQKFSNAIMISYSNKIYPDNIMVPKKGSIVLYDGGRFKVQDISKKGLLDIISEDDVKLNDVKLDMVQLEPIKIEKTSIRIYKNGLINLINIPKDQAERKILEEKLIEKIDNCNASMLEDINGNYKKYKLIPENSYIHSVNCQFNLWNEPKEQYSIKLIDLYSMIGVGLLDIGKLIIGKHEYSNIIEYNGKTIIELENNGNTIRILNLSYSDGKDSSTREEIKCIILPMLTNDENPPKKIDSGIKINLQIHIHGTFQMSMSYCNVSDISNNLCNSMGKNNKLIDDYIYYFTIVQDIFLNIFNKNPKLYYKSLDFIPLTNINTVSGYMPPNKEGSTTAVCRKSDTRPGFAGLRPIPYSFSGQCQESRLYIDPKGVLGTDGYYYPCCSAVSKDNSIIYNNYLVNGFPINEKEEKKYGVTKTSDTKSGILIPGSIDIGAITKAKIDDTWKVVRIKEAVPKNSKKPQYFNVIIQETNEEVKVARINLERDSRYFPGLAQLSKYELIKILIKNNRIKTKILYLEDNLTDIKKLIDIPNKNFNPLLSVYELDTFSRMKYYVTNIPENSNLYYLYISGNDSYYINLLGNKIIKKFSQINNIDMILLGFLEQNNDFFYVIDILYYRNIDDPWSIDKTNLSERMEKLQYIQANYFMTENNIEFLDINLTTNIIKESKDLLIKHNNILLVFIPDEAEYTQLKIWKENPGIEPKEIVLQALRQNKASNWKLGYDNKDIINLSKSFNEINIPLKKINKNDYVLFKIDFNIKTNKLSAKILQAINKVNKPSLTLNETLIKLSLLINPINISFFFNNKTLSNSFKWKYPNMNKNLTYINDDLPLKLNSDM